MNVKLIALIVAVVLLAMSLLLIEGYADLQYHGFGIDSEGRIYEGRNYHIYVYDHDECIQVFDVPQYRTWVFEVSNDKIIIASGEVLTLSLNGEILSKQKDAEFQEYTRIKNNRTIVGRDSNIYSIKYAELWLHVFDANHTPIYRGPFVDFFTRLSFLLGVIGVILFGILHQKDLKSK